MGMRTLIDGGIANTMPLNRVDRSGDDIMIAFNVNDIDVDAIRKIIVDEADAAAEKEQALMERKAENKAVIDSVLHNDTMTVSEKIRLAGMHGHKILHEFFSREDEPQKNFEPEANYFTILSRTFDLMNHWNTELMMKLCPPDVLVNMPFDSFGAISDYARAEEICEVGRGLMKEALDKYERRG